MDHSQETLVNIEELRSEVLAGKVTNLPKNGSNVFRIFISSTFTGKFKAYSTRGKGDIILYRIGYIFIHYADVAGERNVLMKTAIPSLQHYCKHQYNAEFQVDKHL